MRSGTGRRGRGPLRPRRPDAAGEADGAGGAASAVGARPTGRRLTCAATTPTATAALSDSTAGEIGIATRRTAARRRASDGPRPSLPTPRTTTRGREVTSQIGSPSDSSSQIGWPARAIDSTRADTGPRANGTNTAVPALARSAFGPRGSAVPSPTRRPEAPNAAATRRIAPTLPGSWTPSRRRSGPFAPATRSSTDHATSSAQASTPWGATVSLTRTRSRAEAWPSRTSRRIAARPIASAVSRGRSSASQTSRTRTPGRSSASSTAFTPSRRNAPVLRAAASSSRFAAAAVQRSGSGGRITRRLRHGARAGHGGRGAGRPPTRRRSPPGAPPACARGRPGAG